MNQPPLPLLLCALCAAFWPVWSWFITGTLDGSNDSAGLFAAAAAVVAVARAPQGAAIRTPLLLPAICLAAYLAAMHVGMPFAVRGVIMAIALAALASAFRMGCRMNLALLALCMLALPVAATLQFYLGFPLRVLAGELSVILLRLNGITAVREGATLAWNMQVISIDAPCSGIKMLWAGLFIACALAAAMRLSTARTLAAIIAAIGIVAVANALRASALFYMESGIADMPAAAHAGVGVVCFIAAALGILASAYGLQERAA